MNRTQAIPKRFRDSLIRYVDKDHCKVIGTRLENVLNPSLQQELVEHVITFEKQCAEDDLIFAEMTMPEECSIGMRLAWLAVYAFLGESMNEIDLGRLYI